jgi:hypothetical protein
VGDRFSFPPESLLRHIGIEMGLDINAVRFLIAARKDGVKLGEVLTLGRQDLNVYPLKLIRLFQSHGLSASEFRDGKGVVFAEPVFNQLGASRVYSLDASGFEGANFVHDLNAPIGSELKERFDFVYDGGTLEHIFNFPVALRNCMEMVRLGGRLMIHTVANNYCGHGFYQFSPELFYRALAPSSGYEIEKMIMHMIGPYGRWYEVSDPEEIRARVEFITFAPVQLLIRARRVRVEAVLANPPQQSDYTPRWKTASGGNSVEATSSFAPSRPALAAWLPGVARLLHVTRMAWAMYRSQTVRNRRLFRPVRKT